MAQTKRRRTGSGSEDDDDDDSDLEAQDAAPNKRTRVTLDGSDGSEVQTNGDSYSDAAAELGDGQSQNPLAGQYTYVYTGPKQATPDVFETDDEDFEMDELRATQYVTKHFKKKQAENKASDAGIIEEVNMKNFMCHPRLSAPLGPLINFIVGHNGSGKSAILTAITICLGGKASATNRAGNLKNLIKEGEESAWVSVRLKNRGDNAFRPEAYGRSITVERHFSRSGANGYKLKSAAGAVVSTKKTELDDITDYFALQIDNPMNVLSQDMARQFLSNSTPADKYKFYIKGTQLETLDSDYNQIEHALDDTEARCETRQEDVAILGQKKRKAEERKKELDRSQSIQEQIKQFSWEHAWAQVEEQEKALAEFDARIHEAQEKVATQSRAAERASTAYDEAHGTNEANNAVINDLRAELEPKKEQLEEVRGIFNNTKQQLSQVLAQKRKIEDERRAAKDSIRTRQQKIEAERERIENANGPAHTEKVEAHQHALDAIPEHEERLSEHMARRPQLDRAKAEAYAREREANAAIAPARTQVQEAEQLLNRLRTSKGEQSKAYPNEVFSVLRAINAETRWRQKPVGPMGMHITLKKPEWGGIIEVLFGGNFEAFVVTNKHDQSLLSDIIRRLRCRSSILIGSQGHIDTTPNEPDATLDTVMRILDIDNDLVRNQAIINQTAEKIVLIASREQANSFILTRPRNVVAVLCLNENGAGGRRFDFSRTGAPRNNPIRPWSGQFHTKTSVEAQINLASQNIARLKRELDEVENRHRQLSNAFKVANQAVTKHDRDTIDLRRAVQAAQTTAEDLQLEVEKDNINDEGVLDELYAQLREAEGDKRQADDQYQDAVLAKDRIDEENKKIKADMDAAAAEVQQLEDQITKAQNRSETNKRKREEALHLKNLAFQLVEAAKREKEEIEEDRERLWHAIETDLIPSAELISARIPVRHSTDWLDKKIESLTRERQRHEQRFGITDRKKVVDEWAAANDAYERANNDLSHLQRDVQDLKNTLVVRRHRWKLFRKYITTRAKIMFTYLLSERAFRGHIIADHASKQLDISVEPDMTRASDRGRQTKTLSGGEKSFSTICLLLAIWEAMGSPIRCLDEFDVFMDHANREISMKMMVQAARRSVGRQFLLITPQSVSYLEGWEDVRIFRMDDPDRGQNTLPFGEA